VFDFIRVNRAGENSTVKHWWARSFRALGSICFCRVNIKRFVEKWRRENAKSSMRDDNARWIRMFRIERRNKRCKWVFNTLSSSFEHRSTTFTSGLHGSNIGSWSTSKKRCTTIPFSSIRSCSSKRRTKSNWREKHRQLIQSIREARSVTVAMKNGRPLPAFRPSDVPSGKHNDCRRDAVYHEHSLLDYVACPYCRRNFNEHAAKRHIPLCETDSWWNSDRKRLTLLVVKASMNESNYQQVEWLNNNTIV
jgi:hypothetical protein